jgi:ATP-binding cassette, subfamily C (CFTR/MRP), member 1
MLHLLWTFPLQSLVIIGFIFGLLGISALAGIILLFAMIPLQAYVIKVLVNLRKLNAKTTDERVKLTSESLSAIRVIKFFAWEDSFLERIIEIRDKEMKVIYIQWQCFC